MVTNSPIDKPLNSDIDENFLISSIDMLNYYSAIKILQYKTSGISSNNKINSHVITVLADTYKTDIGNNESNIKNDDIYEKVFYYELKPNDAFVISRVSFFQIKVTNEK